MISTVESPSILVLGTGSIGRRHLRNLRSLNVERIGAWDPNVEALEAVSHELQVATFPDPETALAEMRPEAVFVCSPPRFHVSQAAAALRSGAHVFVEKPISHVLDGVDDLIELAKSSEKVVQVGYNLRYHPVFLKVRELVKEGAVGRILRVRAEVGQYLPDWRPSQDYRTSYTARRAEGGGILLDASHEIDYVLQLLGCPSEIACMADTLSNLEVDVEDSAVVLLRFPAGVIADIGVDFVQRVYSRHGKAVGDRGTLAWDFCRGEVHLFTVETGAWEHLSLQADPNRAYLREAEKFLDRILAGDGSITHLEEARDVLKVALLARSSAASKEWRQFE